jgi:hypothetical protein
VHGYDRSKPIDGTVHMVTGGGGAATYGYPGRQPDHSAVRGARHHHLQLSFDANQMVVRAVDDRGVAFDTTTIKPRAAVAGAAAGAAALVPLAA